MSPPSTEVVYLLDLYILKGPLRLSTDWKAQTFSFSQIGNDQIEKSTLLKFNPSCVNMLRKKVNRRILYKVMTPLTFQLTKNFHPRSFL